MIVMMLIYATILGFGAKLIADGSEELLELFPNYNTIIGALLLPILGAVPDSLMILVSGAFGSRSEAQDQVVCRSFPFFHKITLLYNIVKMNL